MKVYIVIERNSGNIEAVYHEEESAMYHCLRFEGSDLYDMEYEEHYVRAYCDA